MINGHATSEGTAAYAGKHRDLHFNILGKTGLTTQTAGFGCYRVSIDVPQHAEALREALLSGINLIDTSANYVDGDAERLGGGVLTDLISSRQVNRDEIIVVSKAGYLQGRNYTLSQQRKAEGIPFQDLVLHGEGLEHCIHPDFLADQLTQSLERLNLETLDAYLLHNPEYYLGWAEKQGINPQTAQDEYYHRIKKAFIHLEKEVDDGRIRFYGVSSNTFPLAHSAPDFTSAGRLWDIADAISPSHRFSIVQLPFNLLETGAVTEKNQSDGKSTLQFCRENGLGVLTNRPLNAISGSRMMRLTDLKKKRRAAYNEIIADIRRVGKSEKQLWRKILPRLDIGEGLKVRIKQQIAIGDMLTHYWRNFGSYERWRQAKAGMFMPRVQGVLDFLTPHAKGDDELSAWMHTHPQNLDRAYDAVGSVYVEKAVQDIEAIKAKTAAADTDWAGDRPLSQTAIRALRSTAGVSSVLVGMRKTQYVADVLQELRRVTVREDRQAAWERLTAS
ncbi:MAG: aldo/keto reductase [Desulfobacteraceae bacterium]|nr:aldo/keto reductase [Desulfobacteraceae bacterium]